MFQNRSCSVFYLAVHFWQHCLVAAIRGYNLTPRSQILKTNRLPLSFLSLLSSSFLNHQNANQIIQAKGDIHFKVVSFSGN